MEWENCISTFPKTNKIQLFALSHLTQSAILTMESEYELHSSNLECYTDLLLPTSSCLQLDWKGSIQLYSWSLDPDISNDSLEFISNCSGWKLQRSSERRKGYYHQIQQSRLSNRFQRNLLLDIFWRTRK